MAISHGFTLIPVSFEIAYDKSCHILYKASCSVASQLSQLPHVTDFVGLSRRSPHRFTLCVSGCGSLPAHIRILAVFHTAPCSYMLASFKHAVFYACFACPKTARLTTALYSKIIIEHYAPRTVHQNMNEINHAARVLSRYRDARRTRILRIRLRLTVRVN